MECSDCDFDGYADRGDKPKIRIFNAQHLGHRTTINGMSLAKYIESIDKEWEKMRRRERFLNFFGFQSSRQKRWRNRNK